MADTLPDEIVVTETFEGVHYRLPRNRTGLPWPIGCFMIVFGCVSFGMGGAFIAGVLTHLGDAAFPLNLFIAIVLLFPLLFVLVGLVIGCAACWLLAGRSEIELTQDQIWSAVVLGPFRWRRRRALEQVRRLAVHRWSGTRGQTEGGNWHSLKAECEGTTPLTLAFGYPEEWLLSLANDLAGRLHLTRGRGEEGVASGVAVIDQARHAGRSRSWRTGKGKAQQLGGCFGCLFFSAFFAGGAFFFVMILTTLLQGDPGNKMQGKPPWEYLWILFPMPFLAIGGGGLIYVWKNWGKQTQSPERQKATGPPPPTGPVIRSRRPARILEEMGREYPTVPQVLVKPGQTLRHRLDMDDVPGCNAIGLGVLILICSGILTPLAWSTAGHLQKGFPALWSDGFMKAVFCGLLALGLAFLIYHFFKQLLLAFLERPVVEVSTHPLEPGERCQLNFSLAGSLRVNSLRVSVRCEEEAKYRQGTDTRTETRCVFAEEILHRESFTIEKWAPLQSRHTLELPAGAMHSFQAGNNQITWKVVVEGDVARWPDFKFNYRFTVNPSRGRG